MVRRGGKRLLLLIGSPRKKGTSRSFALTFEALAFDAGCTSEVEYAYDYFDGRRDLAALRERIAEADMIGIFAPLYYDTLPGVVVWLFEQLERVARPALLGKGLFAVGQCSYPFAALNEPLLASCRCFAAATDMAWLGGLGYGGGVLIDGAPLEQLGTKGEKITYAFQLAIADLLVGQPISRRSQDVLMVRIPRLLYWPLAWLMNLRISLEARRQGVPDLERQVYLE